MAEDGDTSSEASEAVVNGFVVLFLCVLALCMIMNHKFHVSSHLALEEQHRWGPSSRSFDAFLQSTPLNPDESIYTFTVRTQLKYLSEAGAVVSVGLVLSGVIALASKGEAKQWLRGISPTVFFMGAQCFSGAASNGCW